MQALEMMDKIEGDSEGKGDSGRRPVLWRL